MYKLRLFQSCRALWNPHGRQNLPFNVIDYEAFHSDTYSGLEFFDRKWGVTRDFIMQNLLVG